MFSCQAVVADHTISALIQLRHEYHSDKPKGSCALDGKTMIWTALIDRLEWVLPRAHCQDSRDRIFGILGLVSDEARIKVDYDSSAEEIADKVLKRELSNCRKIDTVFLSPR